MKSHENVKRFCIFVNDCEKRNKMDVLPIPPPLLLIRDDDDEAEESLEAKLGGFSMIREFDKLSFRVKLEMVRNWRKPYLIFA